MIEVQTMQWLGPGSPADVPIRGSRIKSWMPLGGPHRIPMSVDELRDLREKLAPIIDKIYAGGFGQRFGTLDMTPTSAGAYIVFGLGMVDDMKDAGSAWNRWAKSMVPDLPLYNVWWNVLHDRLRVCCVDGKRLSKPIIMPVLRTRGSAGQLRYGLNEYTWTGKRR